jgi:hypothetical protein
MVTIRESNEEKEIFEVLRKSEEMVLQAARTWAKAVGDALPVEMPVVRQLIKGSFDFTEAVLEAQREFAHSVLKVTQSAHRSTRTAPAHRGTQKTGSNRKIA